MPGEERKRVDLKSICLGNWKMDGKCNMCLIQYLNFIHVFKGHCRKAPPVLSDKKKTN